MSYSEWKSHTHLHIEGKLGSDSPRPLREKQRSATGNILDVSTPFPPSSSTKSPEPEQPDHICLCKRSAAKYSDTGVQKKQTDFLLLMNVFYGKSPVDVLAPSLFYYMQMCLVFTLSCWSNYCWATRDLKNSMHLVFTRPLKWYSVVQSKVLYISQPQHRHHLAVLMMWWKARNANWMLTSGDTGSHCGPRCIAVCWVWWRAATDQREQESVLSSS